MTQEQIIDGCKRGEPLAQRELYERYAGVMYAICCRYIKDRAMAEDLLHDGFITLYTKIGDFRGEGSFEGWCKRIFVNTALGYLRKNNPLTHTDDITEMGWIGASDATAIENLSTEDIHKLIEQLPEGYRVTLNLYAVEGYSHKEIAEIMGVSENTSRSQYSRARAKLIEILKHNNITGTDK